MTSGSTTFTNLNMSSRCFRFANTFYNWNSLIVVVDEFVTADMEESIYGVLSKDAGISMFRLPSG